MINETFTKINASNFHEAIKTFLFVETIKRPVDKMKIKLHLDTERLKGNKQDSWELVKEWVKNYNN